MLRLACQEFALQMSGDKDSHVIVCLVVLRQTEEMGLLLAAHYCHLARATIQMKLFISAGLLRP